MNKPKRNDPCPCGSGKKFKKCCGNNNVIAFNPTLYRNELDRLHEQLIKFAIRDFEDDLFEIVNHYIKEYFPVLQEEELELYTELIISWTIFTVPTNKEDAIFNLFYDKVKNNIKYPAVRKAFANWSNAQTGIFEVFPTHDCVELKNLTTNEIFTTSLNDEQPYQQGNLAIGTLIPYTDRSEFFSIMIQMPGHYKEEVCELITERMPEDLTMKSVFPQFLADIHNLGTHTEYDMDPLDWEHPGHEAVAYLFKEHATKKGYDEKLIQVTIQYWSDYCKLEAPIIRKHAAHAAALDYFSQVEFLPFTDVTQAELAKEYGTSAGTISNHYNRISNGLDSVVDKLEPDMSTSHPQNMEKQMRDLMRIINEQEFDSEEDLHQFLQGVINLDDLPSAENPRDIAQDLLFEAGEASGKKREQLIQQALDIHPLSSDAYLLLAEDERDIDVRMELLEKAVVVGRQDLGEEVFKEDKGHFWGIIETRPYMRAKATYGMELERLGFTQKAIKVYEELLELNPNDNQGIRYMLLTLSI